MVDVSIVKCPAYIQKNVDEAVERSLKNIKFVVSNGSKVLVKPNILMAKIPEYAVCTHPAVIEAVCKILKRRGCKIVIAESSGWNTAQGFEISGIRAVGEKYGAEIVILENGKITSKIIDGKVLKELKTSPTIDSVDYILNISKMKTHSLTNVTGAVKNIYGLVPGTTKALYHMKGNTEELFADILIDIYTHYRPKISLNIMDAVIGMEGEGPGNGDPKNTGLIIASIDALALDVIQARIMGFRPEDMPCLKAAVKRGLIGLKDVKVIGDFTNTNIPIIKYAPPGKKSLVNVLSMAKSFIFKSAPLIPDVDTKKCVKCGICAKLCPVKCITMKPYPKFDRKICIKCYCCHEHCPQGAIYLKK